MEWGCVYLRVMGKRLNVYAAIRRTTMSSKNKTEVVHARITPDLRQQINDLVSSGSYRNESHFVREAVEEKIQRGEN